MDDGQFERLLAEIAESRRHTDESFAEARRHTVEAFTAARQHTDEAFAAARQHTDRRFDEAQQATAELGTTLREEIRQGDQETRREFHILAEDLRSTVQQVAEGVAMLDGKVDRLRAEMKADSADTRALLQVAFTQLDRRVTRIEGELGLQ